MPLLNSEQLYQALRRLGRSTTELVIYPDQSHAIRDAQLPEGPLRALPRLVRPLPAPGDGRGATGAPVETKPEATSLLGRAALRARARARATEDARGEPGEGHGRVREEPGRRRRHHLARPPPAYLGRFREAIDVFTRGLAKHPRRRAAATATAATATSRCASSTRPWPTSRAPRTSSKGTQGRPEPDGEPNAAQRPHEHAALQRLLPPRPRPLPEGRLRGRREGVPATASRLARGNDDRLVAASDWLYMTLRRLGRDGRGRTRARADHADLESSRAASTGTGC